MRPARRAPVSGFTMLEVLVAILVIAIGLLGMAALQMNALRMGQSAYYRSVATQLAYDMANRMRGNFEGVVGLAYNRTGLATDYADAVTFCTTTTGCSPVDLGRNDAYEWQQQVRALLPGGQGIVCIDSTPDDGTSGAVHGCDGLMPASINERPLHAIKIWWNDDRSEANTTGAKQRFTYSLRL